MYGNIHEFNRDLALLFRFEIFKEKKSLGFTSFYGRTRSHAMARAYDELGDSGRKEFILVERKWENS